VGAMDNNVITAASTAADYVTEVQNGLATTANVSAVETDTQDIQSRLPAALISGRMSSQVGAMANNVISAAVVANDAVTEIQSGLATDTVLGTVASNVTA